MLFVCYPKCSTCAKARKWLEEQEISFEERDIKTDNPTEAELRDWHRRSGLPLKRFFNTSGLQYKALGLKDRLPEMSEDEQYALLATDGMLVKRPLLIGEDFALPGFREKEWLEKLFANGQVATQYVNEAGVPTMDEEWNVNGSYMAIEGITSPDGRVLGKMAHSERRDRRVAMNIYGEQDLRLFESGVEYFK